MPDPIDPPVSIDKTKEGSTFPEPEQGDVVPVSIAPGTRVAEVSQTASTVVDDVQRHTDQPVSMSLANSQVEAAPDEIDPDLTAEATQAQVLDEPVDPTSN